MPTPELLVDGLCLRGEMSRSFALLMRGEGLAEGAGDAIVEEEAKAAEEERLAITGRLSLL